MMLIPEGKPPTPGEILSDQFLKPMRLTQRQFAAHIGWTQPKLNSIIKGKCGVTPETALTLSDAFGTTAQFWLNLQLLCDLWEASQHHKPVPRLNQAS